MTKPLATTEAEIEALPEGIYLDCEGVVIQKKFGSFYPHFISGTEMDVDACHPSDIAVDASGIACRLVPESDLADAVRALKEIEVNLRIVVGRLSWDRAAISASHRAAKEALAKLEEQKDA